MLGGYRWVLQILVACLSHPANIKKLLQEVQLLAEGTITSDGDYGGMSSYLFCLSFCLQARN